jgi:hypothetical protein
MAKSQKCPGKERQKENQLRLATYKKITGKPKLRKTWLLKNINRKVRPSYGLSPIQLVRFCDSWFPVDSSLLATKEEYRCKFYPLASGLQDDKRVLQIRNCQETKFWMLSIENKWLPPGQFALEMQNLQWYSKW